MKYRRILLCLLVCMILTLAACSAPTGNEKQLCADALEKLGSQSEVYLISTTLVGEDPEQMETSTVTEYWISGSVWASCIRPYGGAGTYHLSLNSAYFTMQEDDGLWQSAEAADEVSWVPAVDLERWKVTATEKKDGVTIITMTAEAESTGKVTYSDYQQIFWLNTNGELQKYELSLCTTVPQRDGSDRTIHTKTTMEYPPVASGEIAAFLQSQYEEATKPQPTEPEPTEPDVPETTAPPETESPVVLLFPEDLELTIPEGLPEAFGTTPLELQEWFFQFCVDYRPDYFPIFTEEAGAPADSGEYLYWAFVMNHESICANSENWVNGRAVMDVSLVEETVDRYFGIAIEDHRSHRKSWTYDEENARYIAYPESCNPPFTYLLAGLEYDPEQSIFTAYAWDYHYRYYYDTEEVLERLRQELLYGEKTDMHIRFQIILKFQLDPETQEPLFLAYEELDIMYP